MSDVPSWMLPSPYSSVSKISTKAVQIPDPGTIGRDLKPLFRDQDIFDRLKSPLLWMEKYVRDYRGIVIYWNAMAQNALYDTHPGHQLMYDEGASDYNINKDKFLCFCMDKEVGSVVWDEYMRELGW